MRPVPTTTRAEAPPRFALATSIAIIRRTRVMPTPGENSAMDRRAVSWHVPLRLRGVLCRVVDNGASSLGWYTPVITVAGQGVASRHPGRDEAGPLCIERGVDVLAARWATHATLDGCGIWTTRERDAVLSGGAESSLPIGMSRVIPIDPPAGSMGEVGAGLGGV